MLLLSMVLFIALWGHYVYGAIYCEALYFTTVQYLVPLIIIKGEAGWEMCEDDGDVLGRY